jgi:phosphoglycolate phosphatase-like HAD superfamily hydrolase
MVLDAAKQHKFDPKSAVVVGDKACDIELGKNLGATSVLVLTGYGENYDSVGEVAPDFVINSFADLPAIIDSLG